MEEEFRPKTPFFKNFDPKSWITFCDQWSEYRARGGRAPLERCISPLCREMLLFEFSIGVPLPLKPPAEKKDERRRRGDDPFQSQSEADWEAQLESEGRIMHEISRSFAPKSTFVSQQKFEKLRMESASISELRKYSLCFYSTTRECVGALPPPRCLTDIFVKGLLPFKVRDRVRSQQFGTWQEALACARDCLHEFEAVTAFLGDAGRPRFDRPAPPSNAQDRPASSGSKDKPSKQDESKKPIDRKGSCHICKSPDHWANKCPQKKSKQEESAALLTEIEQPHEDISVSWPTAVQSSIPDSFVTPDMEQITQVSARRRKPKKKSKKNHHCSAIKVSDEHPMNTQVATAAQLNRQVSCLLDTGSSVSLVNQKLLQATKSNLQRRDSTVSSLLLATNKLETVNREVFLTLTFPSGLTLSGWFLEAPCLADIIVGRSHLQHMGVKLDTTPLTPQLELKMENRDHSLVPNASVASSSDPAVFNFAAAATEHDQEWSPLDPDADTSPAIVDKACPFATDIQLLIDEFADLFDDSPLSQPSKLPPMQIKLKPGAVPFSLWDSP